MENPFEEGEFNENQRSNTMLLKLSFKGSANINSPSSNFTYFL